MQRMRKHVKSGIMVLTLGMVGSVLATDLPKDLSLANS
jgi:hypothetical protein